MTENTARLTTALADRYRIERRLGEGGMATVRFTASAATQRWLHLKVPAHLNGIA